MHITFSAAPLCRSRGFILVFILSLLFTGSAKSSQDSPPVNLNTGKVVAVVGAGIGGSCTLHFLRNIYGAGVKLEVFERNKIGGRLADLEVDGQVLELGGSMIYADNYYIRDLANEVGLNRIKYSSDTPFSIFDGKTFVFRQSRFQLVNLAKMVWRYGLAVFKFSHLPKDMFKRFASLYDIQKNGTSFDSPEAFLRQMDLYALTQERFADYLKHLLGTGKSAQRFADELVAAVNRINYNQNNHQLHSLVGLVSLLPAMDPRAFAIEGGNARLPYELLRRSGAILHELAVQKIERLEDGSFLLHASGARQERDGPSEAFGPFDAVVLAAPLEGNGIELIGIGDLHLPPRKYQTTVTTFIKGVLRPSFFGLQRSGSVPGDVFVTENATTPFSVISTKAAGQNETLYKLFSKAELPDDIITDFFQSFTRIHTTLWKAYPKYDPPEQFAPFKLAPGLFYGNAWESAASAMEMSAIAAKNNALLVQKHLSSIRPGMHLGKAARMSVTQSNMHREL